MESPTDTTEAHVEPVVGHPLLLGSYPYERFEAMASGEMSVEDFVDDLICFADLALTRNSLLEPISRL